MAGILGVPEGAGRQQRLSTLSQDPGRKTLRDRRSGSRTARYDGLYVLRTNTTSNPLAVMLRDRELLKVENIFRTTKSILDTRPIYHQKDAAIGGHVFCSFLLRKRLEDCLAAGRLKSEWGALLMELDRLSVTGDVGRAFQAVGVALPPNIRDADTVASTSEEGIRHRHFKVGSCQPAQLH
jgi:hypothetical protein